jgi:hypothetical protein
MKGHGKPLSREPTPQKALEAQESPEEGEWIAYISQSLLASRSSGSYSSRNERYNRSVNRSVKRLLKTLRFAGCNTTIS